MSPADDKTSPTPAVPSIELLIPAGSPQPFPLSQEWAEENMVEVTILRTPQAWAAQDGIKILSWDGWRHCPGLSPKDGTEPLSRAEYDQRIVRSTIQMSRAAREALLERVKNARASAD